MCVAEIAKRKTKFMGISNDKRVTAVRSTTTVKSQEHLPRQK